MIWINVVAGFLIGTIGAQSVSKCGQNGHINGACDINSLYCQADRNALCLPSGSQTLCACSFGTYANADCDRCVFPPGESCNGDGTRCDYDAACIDSKCTCLAEKQPGTNTCLKLAGMKCTASSNCAEDLGLSCVNQACTCTPGIPCLKAFNELCNRDSPCDTDPAQGLVCHNGRCVCPPNQKFVNEKCQLPIGQDCESTPNRCGYNSICHSTSKTCQCREFAEASATTGFCECQKDAYSLGVSSQCACPSNAQIRVLGKCKCVGGWKLDINSKQCVPPTTWKKF